VEVAQLDERLVRCVAPNGLRILTEVLPGVRSAAVGIWVRSASVHEPRGQMGLAHLLEHMAFKGTERRTARELALELESRGGSLDAFTSREHTVFHAHVLDADLPVAVEVLTDLVRRPLLRAGDLALERKVILEEIAGVADTPDDQVFEVHGRTLWPDHPFGYSILGTPDTVQALTVEDLRTAHAAGYYPGNCVIAAAGNIAHDQLMTVLEREGWFEGAGALPPRPPVAPVPAVRGERLLVPRDSQQSHIVLGTDTIPANDPRRYALALLTTVLGAACRAVSSSASGRSSDWPTPSTAGSSSTRPPDSRASTAGRIRTPRTRPWTPSSPNARRWRLTASGRMSWPPASSSSRAP
jgi:predicted Zn-dependent peptidase